MMNCYASNGAKILLMAWIGACKSSGRPARTCQQPARALSLLGRCWLARRFRSRVAACMGRDWTPRFWVAGRQHHPIPAFRTKRAALLPKV